MNPSAVPVGNPVGHVEQPPGRSYEQVHTRLALGGLRIEPYAAMHHGQADRYVFAVHPSAFPDLQG